MHPNDTLNAFFCCTWIPKYLDFFTEVSLDMGLVLCHEFLTDNTVFRNSPFGCSFLCSVSLKAACEVTILLQKIFHLSMSQNYKETILSCLFWLRLNYCPFDLLHMHLVLQWPAACRSRVFYYNITCSTSIYSWRVNNLLFYYMYMYNFLVRI